MKNYKSNSYIIFYIPTLKLCFVYSKSSDCKINITDNKLNTNHIQFNRNSNKGRHFLGKIAVAYLSRERYTNLRKNYHRRGKCILWKKDSQNRNFCKNPYRMQ